MNTQHQIDTCNLLITCPLYIATGSRLILVGFFLACKILLNIEPLFNHCLLFYCNGQLGYGCHICIHYILRLFWMLQVLQTLLFDMSHIYIYIWTKECIHPFPKKSELGLAKNYWGITLTSIVAKIYKALLRNCIEPKIKNILRKNQNGFRRNGSMTSQNLIIRRILEGVRVKNLQSTILFLNFAKAFDSIHRGKMEQILLTYSLPKETIAAIKMLYRNTNVKVHSSDGNTDYFNIVAGVLQGGTLAPYLYIICLDYMLRMSIDKMKDNSFKLTKERSRRYPSQTITDADYADDITLLANTRAQAETSLHSLEWASAGIDLHVNAYKMEYMRFNQSGDISTLNGSSLK